MQKLNSISTTSIGFIFALASSALFAIRPIFVKLVYAEGLDHAGLIVLRMLISAPIYAALLWFFLRQTRSNFSLDWVTIGKIGFAGVFGYYIASWLDLIGLQHVSAQLGRLILYIYPTFVVILGAILFSERITLRTIVALLLSYIGIAILFGHDLSVFGSNVSLGAGFIVGSALSFAIYLIFSRTLIDQVGSRIFTCIALLSASMGIFIHYAVVYGFSIANLTAPALAYTSAIAVFCTVIPTFFTTAAVARIGAGRTGIIATVGPAFTSVFAVAVLNEDFTIYHLIGILLTIVGVSFLSKK